MSKIIEVIDSLTDEQITPEIKETLKSEAIAQNKENSQLYSRAKRAEGFEQDKETKKWIKKEIKPKIESNPEAKPTTGELDYAQKTFISNVLGVKINDTEQISLVKEYLANGKNLDDLIDNKHFKNDLKDIQDNQAAKDAIPIGARGAGGSSAKDSVDYWINKNELPPDNVDLQRKVVNERIKRGKNVSHFAK